MLTLLLMTPTRTCKEGMEAMSAGGGGERDPVPSRLQLVGEGSDMLVLESSSRLDSPGDRRADWLPAPCARNTSSLLSKTNLL